jgi:hypothetical protein
VLYGLGRMDSSGRVGDRAVTSALGWRAGDRLTVTAAAGVVSVRRDPGGLVTMPTRPYVVIPAALRRRCGLRPGDRVLLAVFPARDALAAYPLAVVDQALRAHSPGGPGRRAAAPRAGAGLRRVRPGGVGRGDRRDPPGVRLVLEPGGRAAGRPPPGRADAVRGPAADEGGEGERSAPAERPAAAGRSRCARKTWIASSAWSCCGRRGRRSGGSRSRRR